MKKDQIKLSKSKMIDKHLKKGKLKKQKTTKKIIKTKSKK